MKRVKSWLKRFFGVDEIEERLLEKEKEVDRMIKAIRAYEIESCDKIERYNRLAELLDDARIATDIHVSKRERSWAIVCLASPKGSVKPDGIFFYEFRDNSIMEIQSFLRNFSRSSRDRAIIDCPWGMKAHLKY